jgi:hypothetical protein
MIWAIRSLEILLIISSWVLMWSMWYDGERAAARREHRHADARHRVAVELATYVQAARENRLPLIVEPTRMVHGVIVHPFNGCELDENGVPR